MPLKLTITSYQRLSPGQEASKVLDRGSISIGRAAQNDWVLQDPERILSKSHCTVQYRDGAYFLTDLSVNGTFLNDSEQRIARDQTVRLKDGDHFILGEYEIAVTLLPGTADLVEAALEGPMTDLVPVPGPAPIIPTVEHEYDASLGIGKPSFSDIMTEDQGSHGKQPPIGLKLGKVVTEPTPDLGGPERASFQPPVLVPETPPAPPPTAMPEPPAVIPPVGATAPAPEPLIPDDWWMAPPAPPAAAPSAPRPVTQTPAKPSAPLLQLPGQPVPQPPPTPFEEHVEPPRPMPRTTPATPAEPAAPPTPAEPAALRADILLRAFLEGAGLPQMQQLTEDQLPEVMANLGAIFRETVRGLMEILLARGDIKGEFRLARTAMGPVENNPLKTPPGRPPLSPDEVMTLLLIRQKEAYMSPVQAVREGFNDIKAHQLAVMAGIQAALHRLLARFDPGNLATRLEQSVFDNIWPANRKAKYWDLFTAEYQAIAREAEDDFNELFGDEFARAYEERLRGH